MESGPRGRTGATSTCPGARCRGATATLRSRKFNTHVVGRGAPLGARGLLLEIVPLVDPMGLKAGDDLPVRVLLDGQPLAGARLFPDYVNDANTRAATTDAEGGAVVVVRNDGLNVIGVSASRPTPNDPDAERLSLFATLSFTLPFVER